MSAIKLPARAYRGVDGTWYVSDDANSRLCRSLTEPQAKQIALALNLHGELAKCLRQSHDALRRASANLAPHFGRPENSAFSVDAAMQQNELVLARAETANETKS